MGSHSIKDRSTSSKEAIAFHSFRDYPDADALISRALPWALAAGQPYYDWFCGGREAAQRTVAMWMRQPSSESSIERMEFLQCGSEVAGLLCGLGGAELKKARTADTNSFWAMLNVPSRGALIERISQIPDLFAPVEEDEYYGSKMGLASSFQGGGLSKALVQRYFENGRALGYSKFRADVHTENKPSLRCLHSLGFEIFYTGKSADGALQYHALRCERKIQ